MACSSGASDESNGLTSQEELLITQQPAVITGLVYREQMGQLDLTEAGPDGAAPVVEPPYDLTAIAGENAAEILNASLRAEAKAADLGLVASVMMVDAEGRIWADFVDSALAYGAPPVTAPASGLPAEDDDFAEKGLSNSTDNRLYLGTGSNWTDTHSALSRIGDLSPGACSGALFGRRLVLTAAHCVVNAGGSWSYREFAPRRRGDTYPYGSSQQWGTIWPTAYTANNCHTTFVGSTCVKYDFAVMVLPDPPSFDSHPGWMGVATSNDGTMASWYRSNVGYPSCGSSTSPPNCVAKEPFGDIFGCSGVTPQFDQGSSSNSWPWGDGSHPRMKTGCDTNSGHSGSPVYTYSAGANGPYIIGNSQWNLCTTCSPSTDLSSAGVKVNSALGNWMISLRTTYP
ncbi:MAG: trypsin-like serine protease [Polyangiaceae bacterium]|nr:trypsin-like serine protease [Polyangiaceae bacterium]